MFKKFLFIFIILFSFNSYANSREYELIKWRELIPKNDQKIIKNTKIDHSGGVALQSLIGNMREDLDNKKIKIPGFVIPLEGSGELITEFLLVPYMGACIHVPPPPPNQIIYAKFEKGVPISEIWQTIYVEGTLKVQTTKSDLAEVGYLIEGDNISPYKK